MKKLTFTLFLLMTFLTLSAQESPKIGDKLIIKEPSGPSYNHIAFPKLNFIVKRGKIANYKSVYDNEVVVREILAKDNGNTYVILEKKDGDKFFGFLTKVKANYNLAIDTGELSLMKP